MHECNTNLKKKKFGFIFYFLNDNKFYNWNESNLSKIYPILYEQTIYFYIHISQLYLNKYNKVKI